MLPLHFRPTDRIATVAGRAPTPKTLPDDGEQNHALPKDVYESGGVIQAEWKPGVGKTSAKPPASVMQRLRKTGVRMALQVAMTASSIGPMLSPFSSNAQQIGPETKIEQTSRSEDSQKSQDAFAYHATARDFATQQVDSVKQKPVQVLQEKVSDSTDTGGHEDEKSTLLGYDIDTKFARISASPTYKDGLLKAKVKASAVKFSASKEWTKEDGTQVRRGLSTRVRYEGEATYSADGGFGFQSKNLDTELGLEQRYDKTIGNDVQFAHRYFAGARYRYRFGEQQGSEIRALVQTEQKAYKTDAFQVLGQDFGWEASSRQTFETNWGRVDGNGGQGIFQVEGLVTKKINIKVLGKDREVRLKAGPELTYSTRNGFSVSPEVGVKVKL